MTGIRRGCVKTLRWRNGFPPWPKSCNPENFQSPPGTMHDALCGICSPLRPMCFVFSHSLRPKRSLEVHLVSDCFRPYRGICWYPSHDVLALGIGCACTTADALLETAQFLCFEVLKRLQEWRLGYSRRKHRIGDTDHGRNKWRSSFDLPSRNELQVRELDA